MSGNATSCHIDPHRKRIRRIVLIKKRMWYCSSFSSWITRKMVRQQATRSATFLFSGVCVANAGHALLFRANPGHHSRSVAQIRCRATETVAATVDTSDSKLCSVACGRTSLERSLSVERGLVSWQKHSLRTALPVTVVVASNCMMDVDLAPAWCGRWAG